MPAEPGTPPAPELRPKTRTTRRILLVSVVWLVISLGLVLVTSVELDHEASLSQDGKELQAIVTDNRISVTHTRSGEQISYDVQYQFSVDDGRSMITASDATGRTNLWRSIPQPDYDAAVTSGKIDILYLSQNP